MEPQRKKGTSGLVILLWIIGIGALLVFVGIGVAAYAVWRSPEGRGMLGLIGEIISIQAKAMKAPGTKELRGMGCQQAMVLNFDDIKRALDFMDAGASKEKDDMPFGEFVLCQVGMLAAPPECEAVSKTYLGAVGPRARPYVVSVNVQGKKKAQCSKLYDRDGTLVRDADDPSTLGPVTQPPAE